MNMTKAKTSYMSFVMTCFACNMIGPHSFDPALLLVS